MGSSWWPTWLSVTCSATFAVTLVVHVTHVATMSGWSRLWHGAHVLAAVGMLDMTWPGDHVSVAPGVWVNVFCVGALGLLFLALLPAHRRRTRRFPWLTAAFDLGAMAYMFAIPSAGGVWVTMALAACLWVESAAWAAGVLRGPDDREGAQPSAGGSVDRAHGRDAGRSGGARSPRTDAPIALATSPASSLGSAHRLMSRWSMRISLAAMGAGMAYMLLAMQYGMPDMGPGATGGHHHVHSLSSVPGRNRGQDSCGTLWREALYRL